MEEEGIVSEASWSSFNPLTPSVEESEVMALLFGGHHYVNEQDQDPNNGTQSMFWSDHNTDHSYYSSENANCDPYHWSQGNCSVSTASTSSFFHMLSNSENYYSSEPNVVPAMNLSCKDEQVAQMIKPPSFLTHTYNSLGERACMNEETCSEEVGDSIEKPPTTLLHPHYSSHCLKRKLHVGDLEKAETADGDDGQIGSPEKKARASLPASKKGKYASSKKMQKSVCASNDSESNPDLNAPSSSSYSSEDDSNALQEANGTSSGLQGTLNPNGKKRAGRGSATDPQSLYARKRRERINERLKILQNLVPNGTKVDISTMLEEAVQYVKFLQLQIKLLSSDELWMYAPIAYNGMNIGLDLKDFSKISAS